MFIRRSLNRTWTQKQVPQSFTFGQEDQHNSKIRSMLQTETVTGKEGKCII